ncbi:MAG: hypothetical protein IIB82_15570 [Bacteroidetes bacterium]|nr:hypothetical protein [Bacteroidota bacterium]
MDKMMDSMINKMSPEEKEKMMLQMMPEMMKKADINILTANILEEMGKIITLYGVYSLIATIVKDPLLKEKFGDMLKSMKNKMTEMMTEMMPMMMPMMKELMPKIMSGMIPMMSGMVKEMTEMCECVMADMEDNFEMKKTMGEMMFAMCPEMAGKIIPEEKRVRICQKNGKIGTD